MRRRLDSARHLLERWALPSRSELLRFQEARTELLLGFSLFHEVIMDVSINLGVEGFEIDGSR